MPVKPFFPATLSHNEIEKTMMPRTKQHQNICLFFIICYPYVYNTTVIIDRFEKPIHTTSPLRHILHYDYRFVKSPDFRLTMATPAKSVGLGKTSPLSKDTAAYTVHKNRIDT